MARDMTKKQFIRELEKRGWELEGFFGYVKLTDGDKTVSVSRYNAGDRLRTQLAYLIAQAKRHGISTLPRRVT